MIRKNISLYESDIKKIDKIVENHEGNLSAAMREIIDFVDYMLSKFGSFEEAKKIERRAKGVCLPYGILDWFLRYTDACLPDEVAVESLEEIHAVESVRDLAELVSMCFPVEVNIKADNEHNPTVAEVRVTGERMQAECVAKFIACFLAESRGMSVDSLVRHGSSLTLWMKLTGFGEDNYKDIRDSLLKYFGARHVMMQEILDKPRFWNAMINATADWSDVQRYKYPKMYR